MTGAGAGMHVGGGGTGGGGGGAGVSQAAMDAAIVLAVAPARVVLAAAAQTITAPIIGTPRRIVGTFRVKNNTGTNLSVLPLVNGAATNLVQSVISQSNAANPTGASTVAWQVGTNAWVSGRFDMYIGVGGSAAQRVMVGHMGGVYDAALLLQQIFVVKYADTATLITSIGFNCQVVGGFAIGSELDIKEIA